MAALDVSGPISVEAPGVAAAHDPFAGDDAKVIEAAIKASPTPLAFVCMDGGIFDCNFAFSQMLGYPHNAVLGNTIYMHATPMDIAPLMSAVCELITGQKTQLRRQIRFQHKNGHAVACTLDMSGQPITSDKMYIVVHVLEDSGGPQQPHGSIHISLDKPGMPPAALPQDIPPAALPQAPSRQTRVLNSHAPAPVIPSARMRPMGLTVQTGASSTGHGTSGSLQAISPMPSGIAQNTLYQAAPQYMQPQVHAPQNNLYQAPYHASAQAQYHEHASLQQQQQQLVVHACTASTPSAADQLGFFDGEQQRFGGAGDREAAGGVVSSMPMCSRQDSGLGLGGLGMMDDAQGNGFPTSLLVQTPFCACRPHALASLSAICP